MTYSRALVAALACVPTAARSDDSPTPIGISMVTGGGVTAFAGSEMEHAAGTGVMWTTRVAVGSRRTFGFELTYSGVDRGVTVTGTRNGALEGSSVDAAVRWTLVSRDAWRLYSFGGVGWQRYLIVGAIETMPILPTTENAGLVLPIGVGITARFASSVILDVRGAYRISHAAGIVPETGGGFAGMDAWEATAAVGLEL